jgi:hypothetical protein
MIVAMVPIIDSHLNAALLRTGRCYDRCGRKDSPS